jgi:hypothetical protein
MPINIDFGLKAISKKSAEKAAIEKLRPVLAEWARLVNRYCDAIPDDVPYYYNERANLSLLAAAAWRRGIVALEEYPAKKMRGGGRTDLFFNIGGKEGVQLEAKQHWMRAGLSDKSLHNKIRNAAAAACKAAEQNTEAEARLGCNFLVPFFRKDDFQRYKKEADEKIATELSRYIETNVNEADVWTWCFPRPQRTFGILENGAINYYPGIVIALHFGTKFKWKK